MTTIEAKRVLTPEQAKEWGNRKVTDHAPTDLPPTPFTITDPDTGRPVAHVANLPATATADLRRAILAYRGRFSSVIRSGGMRTKSQTFGYSAPQPVMQRFAPSASAWAYIHPDSHATVAEYAATLHRLFVDAGPPAAVAANVAARADIHPDWRLGDTCWTSGIVNDTAGLYYHYDKNNVPGTWSAMVVVRAGTRGGHLHFADYDVTLPCRDGDVLFFPGMDLLHGVTPIHESLRGGYRFTAVYYAVRRFTNVPSAAEALHASQVRRVELEADLIARQRNAGLVK